MKNTKTNVKVYYVINPSFTDELLPKHKYTLVHEEDLDRKVSFDEELIVCDELFERFNIGDHGGKNIRSMSVGDKITFDNYMQYICAPIGWKKVE